MKTIRTAIFLVIVLSLNFSSSIAFSQRTVLKAGIPFENILLGCTHNHAATFPDEKMATKDKKAAAIKTIQQDVQSTRALIAKS